MLEHDVDAEIVAQMDSSSLRPVLQNTPYQAGSTTQLNEGVNLLGLGQDPSAPPGVQQVHQQYVMQQNPQANPLGQQIISAPSGGMPGQTAGQPQIPYAGNQPQFTQADIDRYRALALSAAQSRIDAEERAFQAEIATLPDDDKERRVLERELEQAHQVNGWLNQNQQSIGQAQQQQAKNMWGFVIATQSGLPYNNPAIKTAMLAANDENEMRNIAQGLVNLITGSQSQQATQQLQSGVFAAGGATGGGGMNQSLQQYEGSGDLSGLLSSRNYQGANW